MLEGPPPAVPQPGSPHALVKRGPEGSPTAGAASGGTTRVGTVPSISVFLVEVGFCGQTHQHRAAKLRLERAKNSIIWFLLSASKSDDSSVGVEMKMF